MPTLLLIALIVVVAIVFYLFPSIDQSFKKLIYVVLAVAVIVWLLGILGLWSPVLLR